jgi:hypothetical protein
VKFAERACHQPVLRPERHVVLVQLAPLPAMLRGEYSARRSRAHLPAPPRMPVHKIGFPGTSAAVARRSAVLNPASPLGRRYQISLPQLPPDLLVDRVPLHLPRR